ncbi:MAG: DUF177 domain-containing protein [Chloroflexi bacterium]|nr:DUF177 domain-containing protein [Chloroflexota bacterium]
MLYNVAQLLKEHVGASRHYEIAGELQNVDEYNPGAVPVDGEVTFIRTPRGILAKGIAHLSLVQPCRRCLELTKADVRFDFEEEYIPSIDIETGAALPITDEDEEELIIDEHHILDLSEVLRQYAVIEASRGALCAVECKGLCPTCGANLNEGPCGCIRENLDPRLAELAKLLGSDQDRETERKNE